MNAARKNFAEPAAEGAAAYLAAIWQCRYFWLSLVRIDLRSRYKRSALGIVWSLLHPIAMTIVLCTVFHRMFGMDIRQYGPFLFAGITFWNFFSTVVLQGCQCLYMGESYIRQHPAPLGIYPLRTLLGAAFHFLLALAVVVVFSVIVNPEKFNPVALLTVIPSIVLLLVLGWSLAVLTGFINVYFPDTQHLTEVGLQILFYMTPILYTPEMLRKKGLAWLVDYNPVSAFLELIRLPIVSGEVPSLSTVFVAVVFVVLATAAASLTLKRLQKHLIFHL